MDFLMRIRPSDANASPARGGISGNTGTASSSINSEEAIAALKPCEVPKEHQAILDDDAATTEAKLTAALAALTFVTQIGKERTQQLEQCYATMDRLSREVAQLSKEVSDANANLTRLKREHQAELDELEDRYGDEEERDRYVQDLEKELKQWRKLGSQGQQMMIQPVQSVNIEKGACGGGGAAAGANGDGGVDGGNATAATSGGNPSPTPLTGDGEMPDSAAGGASSSFADGLLTNTANGPSNSADTAELLDSLRARALAAESYLADAKAKWAATEAHLNASIIDMRREVDVLKREKELSLKNVADLEAKCHALEGESGFRDDNLSSLYEECRGLREMAMNSDHLLRGAEERMVRERERVVSIEAMLSEMRGDLEAEQMHHQQTQRQLATAQKEVQLKSEAVKNLKLEMTKMLASQTNRAATAAAKKKAGASSPADMEEGKAGGGDAAGNDEDDNTAGPSSSSARLSSSSQPLLSDGQAFRADGAVIQVDLNALYSKVASAESWKRAWEKLRDRQQQVRSLGKTQRLIVGGIIFFLLWMCYVVMSAIILVDSSGDDENKAIARRLVVCEAMVQALKHHREDIAEGVAHAAEAIAGK